MHGYIYCARYSYFSSSRLYNSTWYAHFELPGPRPTHLLVDTHLFGMLALQLALHLAKKSGEVVHSLDVQLLGLGKPLCFHTLGSKFRRRLASLSLAVLCELLCRRGWLDTSSAHTWTAQYTIRCFFSPRFLHVQDRRCDGRLIRAQLTL